MGDVGCEVLEILRAERAAPPIMLLQLFGEGQAELRREERSEPSRLASEQPRHHRRVPNVGEANPGFHEQAGIERQVVQDLGRALWTEQMRKSRGTYGQGVDDGNLDLVALAPSELHRAESRA